MTPSPKQVLSCSVFNDSDDEIDVVVAYQRFSDDPTASNDHLRSATLQRNTSFHVRGETIDMSGHQETVPIEYVQVTYLNGRRIQIDAPFDGVYQIEHDWLFTVDNEGIQSTKRQ